MMCLLSIRITRTLSSAPSAGRQAASVKLRIGEDDAPGYNEFEVGNFGDSLEQFLVMFWVLGQFFLREKPLKKPILAQKRAILL